LLSPNSKAPKKKKGVPANYVADGPGKIRGYFRANVMGRGNRHMRTLDNGDVTKVESWDD
jgi:hypothetical protein